MTARRFTVLVVEDDQSTRKLLGLSLRTQGFAVESAESAEVALSLFDRVQPDLVLTDFGLPEMNGVELTQRLKRQRGMPVFLMSGQSEPLIHQADEFLQKPMDLDRLSSLIRDACEHFQEERASSEGRGAGRSQR